MAEPELVLASRSPQRRAILEQVGIEFSVQAADVEELTEGPAVDVAIENAYRKASAVAERLGGVRAARPVRVLGIDTVVSLGARLYGKPADEGEARATLLALSGRRHAVISGVCLIEVGRVRTTAVSTGVRFRTLGTELVDWYLAGGEWRQRAGGYAIQGRGAALVAELDGDYLNVVGLPLATLLELCPGLLPG